MLATEAAQRINADFAMRVHVSAGEAKWTPSPTEGVWRCMLDRIGDEVARATSIVRYDPGSKFPEHVHAGGEEFFVLDGVFEDAHGAYGAGAYVRNPPGTKHAPWTKDGCVLFVKLRQMREDDRASIRIDTAAHSWIDVGAGAFLMPLYEGPEERVDLMRWDPGYTGSARVDGGLELLVIDGAFEDERDRYAQGDWLRLPPGFAFSPRSESGCKLYMKSGHLARPIGA